MSPPREQLILAVPGGSQASWLLLPSGIGSPQATLLSLLEYSAPFPKRLSNWMCTPSGWASTLGVNTRVRILPFIVSVLSGGGEEAPWAALRHTIRAVEDAFVPSGAWKPVVSPRAVVSSTALASGERVCSFLAASVCPCSSCGSSERTPAQPTTTRTAHPITKA